MQLNAIRLASTMCIDYFSTWKSRGTPLHEWIGLFVRGVELLTTVVK